MGSLMTFREVETLFHEIGHALQHMLTTQDEGLVAGIRGVEWDAVETPSQFMENWCYDKATIDKMAVHYETGESIPSDLWNKVVAAKNYRAGSMMLRQLQFSVTDLQLHAGFQPSVQTSCTICTRRLPRPIRFKNQWTTTVSSVGSRTSSPVATAPGTIHTSGRRC